MMVWYRLVLAVVAAYLIGAIPVGYVVIYAMKNKDIRRQGSGRTGGTNAIRAGGSLAGILTGAGDILKGALAVLIARALTGGDIWAVVLAGTAAVIGHNWSPYIGFKGGAGAATDIGVCIAVWPLSVVWLVPLLPFGLNVIGYASVTSLIVAGIIPLTLAVRAAVGAGPWLHVVYGIGAALAIVWALRPNIKRLINGTEPRAPKLQV